MTGGLMGRIGDAVRVLRGERAATLTDYGVPARAANPLARVSVSQETAMRHSAWWACLRLRADLISTLPVDAYRQRDGRQVEVTKSPFLVEPAPGQDMTDWMYASQVDLDRYGNGVGVVTARSALGLPLQVELAPMSEVTCRGVGRTVTEWRIAGEKFTPDQIWHERQFPVAGLPLGLSPLAYAAWTVGGYLSAQEFALQWFGGGARPSGVLRNTERAIVKGVAQEAKASFKDAVAGGDIFVTGKDWEWTPASMDAASSGFLDQQAAGLLDVCRYLGVPGDLIDAPAGGSSITYANITQRNLQLLITNLGPAIIRRERALSRALPKPRFVKLNTDAILRMDPQTRQEVLASRLQNRQIAPSEARALDNLDPFTPEQLTELAFHAQLGKAAPSPTQQAAQGVPWEVPA